jgi:TPR repeat protein
MQNRYVVNYVLVLAASYVLLFILMMGGVQSPWQGSAHRMERSLDRAEQGDASAQHDVGYLYLCCMGLAQNPEKAAEWFGRSANQGNYWSQIELAEMYADGRGVPQSYVQAHMWYELAIRNGWAGRGRYRGSGGKSDVLRMERYMTPAQIAEAKKLADEWKLNREH